MNLKYFTHPVVYATSVLLLYSNELLMAGEQAHAVDVVPHFEIPTNQVLKDIKMIPLIVSIKNNTNETIALRTFNGTNGIRLYRESHGQKEFLFPPELLIKADTQFVENRVRRVPIDPGKQISVDIQVPITIIGGVNSETFVASVIILTPSNPGGEELLSAPFSLPGQ